MFEPFVQADLSTTKKYGGTGLGLSIVKELVERMGGSVGVSSEPNAESIFWFSIPAAAAPGRETLDDVGRFDGKKVLIADDRQINRQVLEHQFTAMGFACTVCSSGSEALEQLGEERRFAWPDLLVLDVKMPGAAGLEVLSSIRSVPALHALPTILMSSVMEAESTAITRDDPKLRKLTKPVRFNELRRTVFQILSPKVEGTAAAPTPARPPALLGKTVLLVEDNKVNRTMALAMLAPLGAKTVVAENGLEGVRAGAFRLGPDGLPDARHGRVRGNAPNSRD